MIKLILYKTAYFYLSFIGKIKNTISHKELINETSTDYDGWQ
jgi:hypothetical protein